MEKESYSLTACVYLSLIEMERARYPSGLLLQQVLKVQRQLKSRDVQLKVGVHRVESTDFLKFEGTLDESDILDDLTSK